MAAALVGQAFLSASVQALVERLTSVEFRDFFKKRKLNVSLLDELETTLLMLDAVLNDAEEKQITNLAVKEWLEKLKDAVFDAEDLLDEINTDSLKCKVEQNSQNANKVRLFFSSSFGQFYWGMNSKLDEISRRLEHIAKQKDILGLQSVSLRVHKTTATSLVNDSGVIGREDDKEKLLKMLLCDEDAKGNDIGVITIWGMGGVGKTTLAKLLYKDKKVQQHFDLKAWACVSEDFNILEVTKNLFESVTKKACQGKSLEYLQVKLNRILSNKKFLIALDDLWNENYNEWDDLLTLFSSGKKGSKIIVTTRQERVVEITHTFPVNKLRPLSNEDCWRLLAKHALGNEDPNKYPELEEIGRKIARKCGGLPLAAKTLGGLLCFKKDEGEWNKILNSNIWDLRNDNILPSLRLSYLDLPSHLKKCFAYCSIFPKDYSLDRKQLVLLWMAEGLVQQYSHGENTMEMEADGYFSELLSRSLIQQHGDDFPKFVMHDLVNDLARFVSGKSCLCYEGGAIPKNVRHLSYPQPQRGGGPKMFESFYNLNCLRTLMPQSTHFGAFLTEKVLYDSLPKLRCLRVLSLKHNEGITELPDSIGDLVHLRYLDLSHTLIKRLPDAAYRLYNLQTLILSWCSSFNELSAKIENLTNLRHLDLSGTSIKRLPNATFTLYNLQTLNLCCCHSLNELPAKIENLTNLRHLDVLESNLEGMPIGITKLQNLCSLRTFLVGKQQNGLKIRELKRLPHLQGKLSILKLQNVVDPMDALEANLKRTEKIEELKLEWDGDPEDSLIVKDVLDMLQPSTNLERLTIMGYGGTSFPNWVGDSSFVNITFLWLRDCNYCLSLPSFGQLPSLKGLHISGMSMVQTIGREFYCSEAQSSSFQPFPYLERLTFDKMPSWEEWPPFEGDDTESPFPRLKHLRLNGCPELRGDLPNNLPSLTKVDIQNCNKLKAQSSTLFWFKSVEELTIENVELPRMIQGYNCLRSLSLRNISSQLSFPADGLPKSLQSLTIVDCENLEFLPQESWQNCTSLKSLDITSSCHSMTFFPLGCFPQLECLSIVKCLNLESFTQVGGSALALKGFYCSGCENLRSMSEVQSESLTALQFIELFRLPNLESLPQCGLPSNLLYIFVGHCERLFSVAIKDWGFQRLASLSTFNVHGDGGDDFVHNLLKDQLLPTSLHCLIIGGFPNLKILDGKGLQHLNSLEELYIKKCPNLESLPEDKLPSSLLLLQIDGCPKLEERYHYQRGEHLSKIAHIPNVKINGKYYDP